jgi:hypothetical protein
MHFSVALAPMRAMLKMAKRRTPGAHPGDVTWTRHRAATAVSATPAKF